MDREIALLSSLRPVARAAVMDLVSAGGIDVSIWHKKNDGTSVANPRANPQFCYEWCFGRGEEPRLLCIWHDDLAVVDGQIVYRGNMKALAGKLDVIAREKWRPEQVRTRSRSQQRRAADFDFTLQRAARRSEPLRIILLTGQAKKEMELGWDASKVDCRSLDSSPWVVQSYSEDDGQFVLVRSSSLTTDGRYPLPPADTEQLGIAELPIPVLGSLPDGEADPSDDSPATDAVTYVDQFDPLPLTRDVAGQVYVRSPAVRQQVLRRSGGCCEWCGIAGFKTLAGAVYLETHHVIPLCEGGADTVANVIALCANDHRRAHFCESAISMRASLLIRLGELLPRGAQ